MYGPHSPHIAICTPVASWTESHALCDVEDCELYNDIADSGDNVFSSIECRSDCAETRPTPPASRLEVANILSSPPGLIFIWTFDHDRPVRPSLKISYCPRLDYH